MGEAKRKSKNGLNTFTILDSRLKSLGINTDLFGFYNQEAFLVQERMNGHFIEEYARWVDLRPRDTEYESLARSVVPKLTQIIADTLKADKVSGGCVLAASMISAMLDRLGVWSYIVVGTATVQIDSLGINKGLYIVDKRDFPDAELGHAWVIAPPFKIVDAAISLQHWGSSKITERMPFFLTEVDKATPFKPYAEDVVCPEFRQKQQALEGYQDTRLHYKLEPNLESFNRLFPAHETHHNATRLRYVPVAVRLPDVSLEEINAAGKMGRPALDIWKTNILPEFPNAR